jgi:phosphatidylserine synthase 2
MGQHVWLLLATIVTELLVILKWSRGQFTEPFPQHIKYAWALGGTLLTIYPTVMVKNHISVMNDHGILTTVSP